jgi:glycosyltransferase involved in cell wall biosynthesis
MPRRVLMISPHFPPDSTAGTHRVRLLAPRLREHGWEPTVLTVDPRDYAGRLDPALAASVPDDLHVVRQRAWSERASRRLGVGDLGLRAFSGLRQAASRLLAAERFDAVFVTIYPAYPALLGPLLKRRFRVPFVLDYQDPWVGEWGRTVGGRADGRPDVKSRLTRFVAARLEPLALRAADAVTAVSIETYEQALARTPSARPRAVAELPIGWDARDIDFVSGAPARVPSGDGCVHLSYVGTLLPTGADTLRALLRALASLRRTQPSAAARLRLHFFGTSNQRGDSASDRVLPMARELGVADAVTEHAPRLDYFDALQVLRESDAVLLMGSRERHYTPSKVFPALMAKRPLLAVFHEASTVTALLRRAGCAPTIRLVSFDDARPALAHEDEIAAQLLALAADAEYRPEAIDLRVMDALSASSLAGRLADLFDRCQGEAWA